MIRVLLFTILFSVFFFTELLIPVFLVYYTFSLFVFYIKGGMIPIRRKPAEAELQQAHIELLHRISSPMYGNRRGTRTKPQSTQPIPTDTNTIDNVKTEGEGTKTPQSPSKGKQPVKEKKPRGKKGKMSNTNKEGPRSRYQYSRFRTTS